MRFPPVFEKMDKMNIPLKASEEFWEAITSLGLPSFIIVILILLWGIFPAFPLIPAFALYLVLELTAAVIKFIFPKDRPDPQTRKTWFEKYQSGSFPSVHTARITYLTTIVMLSGFFSQTALGVMLVITTLVAYSRVYLKKHFFMDISGGLILGFAFGFVFTLM